MVKKRVGQRVGGLSDAYLPLLHRLQQRGLSLGRSSVDFVGQQNVREHRPFDKTKTPPAMFVFV